MNNDNKDKMNKYLDELSGEKSAIITILNLICDHNLDRAGAKFVVDVISGMINDLESLWGDSMSDSQRSTIECFKRYQFRLSKFKPLAERDETALKYGYFVCIECNFTIIPDYGLTGNISCPQCNTNKWLELITIEKSQFKKI